MHPRPIQDDARAGRVVGDICELLHDNTPKTQARAARWIEHVLNRAALHRRWWFLENVTHGDLDVNEDVVDLRGHISAVAALYIGRRLHQIPLSRLVELREAAQTKNRPNGGPPTHYALEAGFRVHLWPCPIARCRLAVLYSRPVHIAIVPPEWETIVLDGVLGMYGRHFDRDALTQDPAEFERRFWAALRNAATADHDIEILARYRQRERAPSMAPGANSNTDTAIDFAMPASLTGIGYVTIDLDPYPLIVE